MILVFGKNGQVATEMRAQATVEALDRHAADLSDPESCAAKIIALKPEIVINTAAYTAVDKAEDEEELAARINADAPAAMARACAELGIPFVHISTDYVFEGTGTHAQSPDQPVSPQSAYGRTKLAGETGIIEAGGIYAILRTSWVFSTTGSNFVKTMLRLGSEKDALSIVADQIGGPTPASDIARACLKIGQALKADPSKRGVYHFSGTEDCSWADFAAAIFETAEITCKIKPVPTTEFPRPAKRPANSRLDCSTTLANFGIERPDWRAALKSIIAEIKETT